jgi:hypothetical protein
LCPGASSRSASDYCEHSCISPDEIAFWQQLPFGQPLDLSEPADVILAKTETMVRQDPTSCPIEAWSADMRKKLDEVHTA